MVLLKRFLQTAGRVGLFLFFSLLVLDLRHEVSASANPTVPAKFVEETLSAEDWKVLEGGEIVYRRGSEEYLGGTVFGLIAAPKWRVWQTITDYPKYSEFMPRNAESRVVSTQGDTVILYSSYISAWPLPNIWNESLLTHETASEKRLVMKWRAEKTNLTVNFGSWTLVNHQEKTLVIYHSQFLIPWVPEALAQPSAKKSMLETFDAVSKRVRHPRYDENFAQVILVWKPPSTDSRNLQTPAPLAK